MATVLAWTREISHLFVAMFGNTLTFSALPLRAVLSTQVGTKRAAREPLESR
jgi:hypothetical protein